MMQEIRGRFGGVKAFVLNIKCRFNQAQSLNIAKIMTLVLLLLHFSAGRMKDLDQLFLSIVTGLTTVIALAYPPLRKHFSIYAILFFCLVFFIVPEWQFKDNHIYLWMYWLLALFIAHCFKDSKNIIQNNAKYLIGFTMLFATLQKLRSINYISGAFFYFTLLTDPRFHMIGGLFSDRFYIDLNINNAQLLKIQETLEPVYLSGGSPELLFMAQLLTWLTLLIEASVALTFLVPDRWGLSRFKHLSLIIFCGIYFLVPIKGFASVLLIMGLATLKTNETWVKAIYLGLLVYIFWFSNYVLGALGI